MVVHRHNFQFQNGPPCVAATPTKSDRASSGRSGSRSSEHAIVDPFTCAFKQVFSDDAGVSWSAPSTMKAGADGFGGDGVPPHSVMPEIIALGDGGGYALTGGRSGLYFWHCQDVACIDAGEWTTTNLALHHNNAVGKHDPAGAFSADCVNASLWNTRSCSSKGYIGLARIPTEVGGFLACYDHATTEVYCVRGHVAVQ